MEKVDVTCLVIVIVVVVIILIRVIYWMISFR